MKTRELAAQVTAMELLRHAESHVSLCNLSLQGRQSSFGGAARIFVRMSKDSMWRLGVARSRVLEAVVQRQRILNDTKLWEPNGDTNTSNSDYGLFPGYRSWSG
jgi:hypothetical protein